MVDTGVGYTGVKGKEVGMCGIRNQEFLELGTEGKVVWLSFYMSYL